MKKSFWILGALILIVVAFLGVICLRVDMVNIEFAKDAKICFQCGNIDAMHLLESEEVELLKTIFNGKKMYKDNLSCGFSESVSIRFNEEQTFCIARDTCPIVYWKEKNRYIKLSEDEKRLLYDFLEPYGFFFPCV